MSALAEHQRLRWPRRVLIVGWAAEMRWKSGYRGLYLEDGTHIWNPVEVLSDYIGQEVRFHNLANLIRKDPMVEMLLDDCAY